MRRMWVGLLVAVVLIPAPTAGQEPVEQDTTPVYPHPEVVVRATRMPMPAAALPFAVTVRRPGEWAAPSGVSLADELLAVPGLQVQSRYNEALGDRIVMRGFGARAQFGVRGVQVLVDGIPATMPDGQTTLNHLDISLLDRAEVLRGPAAASHGNAAGGVLLLGTRPPVSAGFRWELSAVAGGHGLYRMGATGGSGLGSRGSSGAGGWIASLGRETRDGFRPHSDADRYQATGRVDAPLAGGFLRVVGHGVDYDAENPGALTAEQFAADPYQAQAFNVVQATGESGRHGQLGATWERPLAGPVEGGRLEASVYGIARAVENPIPPSVIVLDRRAVGLRALVRSDAGGAPDGPGLESGGAGAGGLESGVARLFESSWRWAVGVDAALQADDRQNHENVEGDRGELTLDQQERVSNVALHGQALVPLVDRLGLYLSGRYDRIGFSADDRFITPDNPDDSGDRAMDAVSPAAGLRLRLTPSLDAFGNISTAFQTPTTTELVNRPDGAGGFNEDLEPQRTVSYEVGARAALRSGLSVEAAAYRARIRDALVAFEVPSAPGRQYFRNAGETLHQGVEVAGELTTGPVRVLASYSRTDARFESYAVDDAVYDGNAVPGVRPWVVEAAVLARPGGRLALQLDYRAAGAMTADNAGDAVAPGYHVLAARAGARGVRIGGVEVTPYLGVDNVLDEVYVASVVPNAFGGRYLEPGPGRTVYFGVGLGVGAARPAGR